jgi:hypothetical protein
MEKLIEIYAFFLLTILGFIVPTFAILLTLFHDGLAKLAQQYQNERNQTEKKLTTQLQKAGDSESLNVKEIEQTIKELKLVKKTADAKLSLLSPKKTILRIIIPLAIAFVSLLPSFFLLSIYTYVASCLSLLFVGYVFVQFWKLLDILVEVKSQIDLETKNDQRRIPELLAEIAGNTKKGASYFIERIFIKFNNVLLIKDTNEFVLTSNKKTEVPIQVSNLEKLMAKDVEAGFRFPIEFLIEKTSGYTIYASADEQIVRYSVDRLHGDTNYVFSPLVLTPLKKGEYIFKTFIKGENIESKSRDLKITVK